MGSIRRGMVWPHQVSTCRHASRACLVALSNSPYAFFGGTESKFSKPFCVFSCDFEFQNFDKSTGSRFPFFRISDIN